MKSNLEYKLFSSLDAQFGACIFNQPADRGMRLSYDFKAGSKVPLCCPTFFATNNTCLAIHLSKSHPVSGWLSVLVMDNRSAKSQVFCSVGVHGFRQQPFGFVSTPGNTWHLATFFCFAHIVI